MSCGKLSLLVAISLAAPGNPLRAEEAAPARGMVAFDILIAEFRPDSKSDPLNVDSGEKALAQVKDLESKGKIGSITRFHLTSLDQQQARIQIGERAAVAVSRAVAGGFGGGGGGGGDDPPGRRSVTSYQMENHGTLVTILPRLNDEGAVTAQLNIERSRPAGLGGAKDKEKDDGGAPIPPRSTTLTAQTAVQLKSDQTVAIGGMTSESGQFVILVTAHVTLFPANAKHAAAPAGAGAKLLRVYALKNSQANDAAKTLLQVFRNPNLRLGTDARTNSLIAEGEVAELDKVEALLLKLDAKESGPKE